MFIWNWIKEKIDGFWQSLFTNKTSAKYIPQTLDEAVGWMEENIAPADQKRIAEGRLSTDVGHHTVGRWMRNNWGLWEQNSNLYRYFCKLGIRHPDDITGIIFKKFECRLQGVEFSLRREVERYRKYWINRGQNPDTIMKNEKEKVA